MLGALSAEDIHIQYRILPDCQRTNISTAQTISQNRIKKKKTFPNSFYNMSVILIVNPSK